MTHPSMPGGTPDRARLDALRDQVQAILLARQDPVTGLLPASTAITVHGDYTHAWVRDNVYSILAVWAPGLAYRRVDAEAAAPLDAAVVRLMRGLLHAMQRQAHKVERFKHTQNPMDALHAKYHTATGEPVVGDADWGHLQIDATAIFVLQLRQMSESGLAIVQTPDEVAFVQNLVWYLAKAWRTPDYGIWERGHKRNEISVRLELQADCFAGVWGHAARGKHLLEAGDLDEALTAATAIGDDRLQKQAGMEVHPETFTHGSSAQRVRWFRRGFDTGQLGACDTFSASEP